jgi:hypothetical protein
MIFALFVTLFSIEKVKERERDRERNDVFKLKILNQIMELPTYIPT